METLTPPLRMTFFSSSHCLRSTPSRDAEAVEESEVSLSSTQLFFSPLHLHIRFLSTVEVKEPHWSAYYQADIAFGKLEVNLLNGGRRTESSKDGTYYHEENHDKGCSSSLGSTCSYFSCFPLASEGFEESNCVKKTHSSAEDSKSDGDGSSSISLPFFRSSDASLSPTDQAVKGRYCSSLTPLTEYALEVKVENLKEKLSTINDIYLQQVGMIIIRLRNNEIGCDSTPLQEWRIVCQGIRPSTQTRDSHISSWFRNVYSPLE